MAKMVIPTSPEELEEILRDDSKMKNIWKEGQFAEFMSAYAKGTVEKNNGEIANQMREQMQLGFTQFMRENGAAGSTPKIDLSVGNFADRSRDPILGPLGLGNSFGFNAAAQVRKNYLYNKAAPGSKVNGSFANSADFLKSLALKANTLATAPNAGELLDKLSKNEEIRNSFGTNVPADGGFLVPEDFRSDILLVALEKSIIRQRATVIPMSTQRVTIPAADSTSDASSVFGGIVCSWVDEGSAPGETSSKFMSVTLDTKKLMAYLTAPNELIADAPAFGGWLDAALPQAMAFYEDAGFMTGTGAGEPLGFINCAAAVIAAAESGQGANTITTGNLAAMFARMLPSSLTNAIWVADIGTFTQLAQLSVPGVLGNSTPVWMNNGVVGAPPISIYGRPVFFTEKCSVLGTTGDINFIDPAFYLIGDRQIMQATASPHALFSADKTAYKVIERVDGRPWIQSAITPKNSGNTLSPFVQLSSTRT